MTTKRMKQVQVVRRRMVMQQVRMLRRSGIWSVLTEDHVADCVLAAAGDAVVAHRLLRRWQAEHDKPRTQDLSVEDEEAIVQFIQQQAAGFDCDCGTCGGRSAHQPVPARKQAMTDVELQVQQVRRRLVRSTAEPFVRRLQLMTVPHAPRPEELLDALIVASGQPNDVEPVQRVYVCWERWMLVMHNHESFGAYVRRNIRWRP